MQITKEREGGLEVANICLHRCQVECDGVSLHWTKVSRIARAIGVVWHTDCMTHEELLIAMAVSPAATVLLRHL